jgi:hypothetical protein
MQTRGCAQSSPAGEIIRLIRRYGSLRPMAERPCRAISSGDVGQHEERVMDSISSVSSPPDTKPVQASPPPPPPPPKDDNDISTQPTKAALPPGQGTRVDQIA